MKESVKVEIKEQEKKPEVPKISDEKLFLIDISERAEIKIPDEVLDKITEKAIKRSKRLCKQARKNIENELNNMIFSQLSKLEMKFEFMKKFWTLYEQDKQDIKMVREECLAERVALSALKSSSANGMPTETEKQLWQNQFACSSQLLEQINE